MWKINHVNPYTLDEFLWTSLLFLPSLILLYFFKPNILNMHLSFYKNVLANLEILVTLCLFPCLYLLDIFLPLPSYVSPKRACKRHPRTTATLKEFTINIGLSSYQWVYVTSHMEKGLFPSVELLGQVMGVAEQVGWPVMLLDAWVQQEMDTCGSSWEKVKASVLAFCSWEKALVGAGGMAHLESRRMWETVETSNNHQHGTKTILKIQNGPNLGS